MQSLELNHSDSLSLICREIVKLNYAFLFEASCAFDELKLESSFFSLNKFARCFESCLAKRFGD